MLHRLEFSPFRIYIAAHSLSKTRNRYRDSLIQKLQVDLSGQIQATVIGSRPYQVRIFFNPDEVTDTTCSCPYDDFGICKHVIHVMAETDRELARYFKQENRSSELVVPLPEDGSFLLPQTFWTDLTDELVQTLSDHDQHHYYWYDDSAWLDGTYLPRKIEAHFRVESQNRQIAIWEETDGLHLKCDCSNEKKWICSHLSRALSYFKKDIFRFVFDADERLVQLKTSAATLGISLPDEELEELFQFVSAGRELLVKPKYNLVSSSEHELLDAKEQILHRELLPWEKPADTRLLLLLRYSSYHQELNLELMQAKVARNGSLKSPISVLDPYELMNQASLSEYPLFFQSLALLQQPVDHEQAKIENRFNAYRNILKNPMHYPVYLFDDDGGKVTPSKLLETNIQIVEVQPHITVTQKDAFFEITCKLRFDNHFISSNSIRLIERLFFRYNKQFYFPDSLKSIYLLEYFARNKNRLYLHQSQFQAYKEGFLNELENQYPIQYQFLRKATPEAPQKVASQPVEEVQKILYLSESDDYILLTPAIRYGEMEIPLLSKRRLYETLPDGTLEEHPRNEWLERGYLKLLRDLHPDFETDTPHEFVYLHRSEFLDNGWFLDAFEKLRSEHIQIFGFAQLSKHRLNEHKPVIRTQLSSGINWFDIEAQVQFGQQAVQLQDLQKAILKRSAYVELGDGTHGLLPEAWIDRFGKFFRSGEIKEGRIRVSKAHFQLIDDLFREEAIDREIRESLNELTGKLVDFQQISQTKIPKRLKAELRDYQKAGLNWLNFLDEFGFGGCLADDMGLGKTVQVLAYILSQHEKGRKQPNLVVVPTSLIFNWRNETAKFAPHLKILELWGSKRQTKNVDFNQFDLVLISYGTLLSDIEVLREQEFNLLILDESQAIKNPNSKRYKAVRLLRGRQRLVLTGTPIENNTFDLFAQLSFTMPGLLGTARSFLELYANPIDRFQDTKRAKELQRKVHPFILRRTKKQVAKELPEKTEMIVFCEMGKRQRQLYDTYKQEFNEQIRSKTEDELKKDPTLILQGMTKLRQICNSSAILGDPEDYGSESAKIDELMLQIEDKKDGHKILVFSQFVSMLNLIRKELEARGITYCFLSGETRDRQAQVDRFQNDDETRVFLISLKAGGTGLNLTEADYVFLVDPWWNPAVENQAIDRAYRIGQDKHVVAVRLITPDSIEEKMLKLQERKKELADELIHTDNAALKTLSKSDLLELIQ